MRMEDKIVINFGKVNENTIKGSNERNLPIAQDGCLLNV